jgi:hemerythrin-like domain-containing protein
MPTAKTPRRPAGKTTRARQPDAIALLKDDHAKVSALFEQYGKSRSATKKQSLVATICRELTVHAMVEEEIFYPAVKAALKDKELVPEALVEHATLKEFVAKLEGRQPDGEMFDAQVQVMGEYVKHHVKEEQTGMFPRARKAGLDLARLGQQILDRKQALMADPEGLPKAPAAVAELSDEAAA